MRRKFRLLPIVIVAVALTFSVKLASIWQGIDIATTVSAAAKSDEMAEKEAKGTKGAAAQETSGAAAKNAAAAGKDGAAAGNAAGEASRRRQFDPASITESELVVLQKLSARRAELEKRERDLDMREKLLKAAEKRLDVKIAELTGIKQTIEGLLKKHDAQQEAKLKSLVKIYENMKPKDAARIFEKLNMPILLDVIERMREAKTAPIMANMAPDKAQEVTAALAARRTLPKPTQRN